MSAQKWIILAFLAGDILGFFAGLILTAICVVSREADVALEHVARKEAWKKLGWRS